MSSLVLGHTVVSALPSTRSNTPQYVRAKLAWLERLPWAQEVPSSNLGAPTKNISRVFFYLLKAPFTSNPICGILADRRSQFASRLVSKSSPHDEFAKTRGGRSAIQKLLNGRKLIARDLASMGKIQGTLCISGPIKLRKCESGDHALGPACT